MVLGVPRQNVQNLPPNSCIIAYVELFSKISDIKDIERIIILCATQRHMRGVHNPRALHQIGRNFSKHNNCCFRRKPVLMAQILEFPLKWGKNQPANQLNGSEKSIDGQGSTRPVHLGRHIRAKASTSALLGSNTRGER